MCRACVNQLAKKQCPICNACFAGSQLKPMPFVQGMVWRLRVKCRQHEDGCDWTGELGVDSRNLKEHDAACPLKLGSCSQCDQSVRRGDIQKHQLSQCPERQFIRRAQRLRGVGLASVRAASS
jgi:hypothetical protein